MVIFGFWEQERHRCTQEKPGSASEHPGAPRKVPHPSKSQKAYFFKRTLKRNLEREFYGDFGILGTGRAQERAGAAQERQGAPWSAQESAHPSKSQKVHFF